MADNKKTNEKEQVVKKPIIKNNTLIAIILIVSLVLAIVLFVMNVIKGKGNESDIGESSKREWQRVADTVSNMFKQSDLKIEYINSKTRTAFVLVGSTEYYGIQFSNNKLYVSENNYTKSDLTDEQKISEAESGVNNGMTIYSQNVTVLSAENYDSGKNTFSEGVAQIRLGIGGEVPVTDVVSIDLNK